jgi:Domain of unknown function (DUF4365)
MSAPTGLNLGAGPTQWNTMSDITPQSLGLGLSISHAQEQFSKAFVLAVAALAGCSAAEPQPDVDSIDWTLSCRLSPRRPKLDLQVKSAINDVGSPELIHYPLKRKNYDDLILTNLLTRRPLVLVVLPPQPEAWLSVSPEQLVLRRCAYWCSLAGFPESANESSVTVHVARANLFDVAALTGLMQEINEGGVS